MTHDINQVILITGATKGLGAALAETFAAPGTHLVLLGRRQRALEKLDNKIVAKGGTATLVSCDLENHYLLDQLAHPILERFGKLDMLIGNAAILPPLTPTTQIDPKDFQKTIDINLTANWRLLRVFSPLLERAPRGKALFMTCDLMTAYNSAYAASKAGLETIVQSYAKEMATTNVTAHLVDPGPMNTALRRKAFPGLDPQDFPTPIDIAQKIYDLRDDLNTMATHSSIQHQNDHV